MTKQQQTVSGSAGETDKIALMDHMTEQGHAVLWNKTAYNGISGFPSCYFLALFTWPFLISINAWGLQNNTAHTIKKN